MTASPLGVGRTLRTALARLARQVQEARERVEARRSLTRRFPRLRDEWQDHRQVLEDLSGPHGDYVRTISSQDMALSLEMAGFLAVLCGALRPRRILDLGSGFSSFVLRRYAAAREGVTVLSVDDDAAWLERTRAYLESARLPVDGLLDWASFRASPHEAFDLVLHDLGSMSTRIASLPFVLDRVVEVRGVLLLDDVHKPDYAQAASEILGCRQHHCLDLAPLVADQLGRYGWLVTDLSGAAETRE